MPHLRTELQNNIAVFLMAVKSAEFSSFSTHSAQNVAKRGDMRMEATTT
jgi:hypothetical protein